MSKKKLDRRTLLKLINAGVLSSPFAGGISPFIFSKQANAATNPHRFLQIFLQGGWDMCMATDPAVGGKAAHADYNAYHNAGDGNYLGNGQAGYAAATAVGGTENPNLQVGWGLKNMIDAPTNIGALGGVGALRRLPTAFVNGMFVEVTAHELGVAYLYSGKLSLSRSKEYPAIIATMADKVGGFPAHLVLGDAVPLGSTKSTNPPLQSTNTTLLAQMMAGPKYQDPGNPIPLTDSTIASASGLIDLLNNNYAANLAPKPNASLTSWNNAESGMAAFYAQDYAAQIDNSAIIGNYGPNTSSYGVEAKFSTAFKILESGMTRFLTVNFGGFDTHQNHNASHLPVMQSFCHAMNQLAYDLAVTDDPLDPGKKLADNTTILITSEFNRTPKYNNTAGTDHWRTGTAMLMGRGVKKDTVFGSTNDQGYALDTTGTNVIGTSQDANVLLPDHLAAAVLRHLGFTTEAEELTNVDISSQLFT